MKKENCTQKNQNVRLRSPTKKKQNRTKKGSCVVFYRFKSIHSPGSRTSHANKQNSKYEDTFQGKRDVKKREKTQVNTISDINQEISWQTVLDNVRHAFALFDF